MQTTSNLYKKSSANSVASVLVSSGVCLIVGVVLGILATTMWFTRTGPLPVALSSQRAEVVLVVQTATPASGASTQPLQPLTLPDATTADTLKGARDYLRAGGAASEVQVVLFEDGQCPFCKQLSIGPIRQLIDEYAASKKVAVTYRHYAFLGDESRKLAAAMECAGRLGKFWEYHDQAFANQQPENAGLVTDALLSKWAASVTLDAKAFSACLGDPQVQQQVADDFDVGRSLRIQGTPTLFVNGKRMSGAVPYDFLKSAVDEALRASK